MTTKPTYETLEQRVRELENNVSESTHELNERVKELNCLYNISEIFIKRGDSLDKMLQHVVDLIPTGWQYPEITCARIRLKDNEFKTKNFAETVWKQARQIVVREKPYGMVEIYYLESRPEADEGPFLRQEDVLQDTIAKRLGKVVERIQAETALRTSARKLKLQNQIASILLSTPDNEMYGQVLEVVLKAMKSKYGIFGYIDEKGSLNCPSLTKDIWDKCRMSDKTVVYPRDTWGGIWGKALIDKKTLYSNEPFKVPEGHVPIFRALDVPIVHQEEVIGNLLMGNKETDYDAEDKQFLEEIVRYIAPVLHARLQRDREEKEGERLSSQLRRTQKMEAISTLAGGIAHDFNNILSAIVGFGQLAQIKMDPESDAYGDLEEVLQAGERAKLLIKQILAVGRSQEQEKQPIRFKYIVREGLKFLRSTLPSTIEIRETYDKDIGVIDADPTQMHQVLINLCTNASHAMGEETGVLDVSLGDVELRMKGEKSGLEPGKYQKLTVSDTGCGMSPETLGKIFDPYFTTKPTGEGSGIGLSVVHGIIAQYNGNITVVSEPEKGTTFHVYLPVTREKEQAPKAEKETPLPTGGERILFIDDDRRLAKMGGKLLKSLGYKVTAMTNSIDALALFREHPKQFDLVFTDTTMPHMPGDILARELMKIRPDIPVVICTGHSKRITGEIAKEIGIKAFLMKPLTLQNLAETARKVLENDCN